MKDLKIKTIDTVFYDRLGLIIRNARQRQRLSLLELSKRTGISRVQLEYYELGYSRIKEDNWILLCKCLGIKNKFKVDVRLKG